MKKLFPFFVLLLAVSLSGCQTYSKHDRVALKHLRESYKNGDITRQEYEEALDRYRKSAKGPVTEEQSGEGGFSF